MKAEQLASNETLQEALTYLHNAALDKFHAAKNPTAAWEAKLEYSAIDQFAAQLLLYIRSGADAVAQLRAEAEEEAAKRAAAEDESSYLMRAMKARKEFDQPTTPAAVKTVPAS
jgi:hypothetical protein